MADGFWSFGFDRNVFNVEFLKCLANGCFDFGVILIGYDMEGGVMMIAVNTPDMEMVDAFNTGKLRDDLLES